MVKPLGSRLLIEQIKETSATSDSGIFLGEERAPQSIKAKVLAVGDGCTLVKKDDVILISQFAPTEARESIKDNTLIASEEDVLAVIE